MYGQRARLVAGNPADHIVQCVIGSHLIALPGDGCNLERRNNAVRFFINLRVLKVILEPLALHPIIRLLVWRYIRFNDEVVALQIKIQDFHGILLPF